MGAAEGERLPGVPQLPLRDSDGLHQADARAAEIHTRYLSSEERTCIDCHKGIAHELPDMTGIEPAGRRGQKSAAAKGQSKRCVIMQATIPAVE